MISCSVKCPLIWVCWLFCYDWIDCEHVSGAKNTAEMMLCPSQCLLSWNSYWRIITCVSGLITWWRWFWQFLYCKVSIFPFVIISTMKNIISDYVNPVSFQTLAYSFGDPSWILSAAIVTIVFMQWLFSISCFLLHLPFEIQL